MLEMLRAGRIAQPFDKMPPDGPLPKFNPEAAYLFVFSDRDVNGAARLRFENGRCLPPIMKRFAPDLLAECAELDELSSMAAPISRTETRAVRASHRPTPACHSATAFRVSALVSARASVRLTAATSPPTRLSDALANNAALLVPPDRHHRSPPPAGPGCVSPGCSVAARPVPLPCARCCASIPAPAVSLEPCFSSRPPASEPGLRQPPRRAPASRLAPRSSSSAAFSPSPCLQRPIADAALLACALRSSSSSSLLRPIRRRARMPPPAASPLPRRCAASRTLCRCRRREARGACRAATAGSLAPPMAAG